VRDCVAVADLNDVDRVGTLYVALRFGTEETMPVPAGTFMAGDAVEEGTTVGGEEATNEEATAAAEEVATEPDDLNISVCAPAAHPHFSL